MNAKISNIIIKLVLTFILIFSFVLISAVIKIPYGIGLTILVLIIAPLWKYNFIKSNKQ